MDMRSPLQSIIQGIMTVWANFDIKDVKSMKEGYIFLKFESDEVLHAVLK